VPAAGRAPLAFPAGRRLPARGRDRRRVHGLPAPPRARQRPGHARPAAHRSRLLPRQRGRIDHAAGVHPAGSTAAVIAVSDRVPVTLAMTGASGAPYAVRLLEALNQAKVPVRLIISKTGWRLLHEEL